MNLLFVRHAIAEKREDWNHSNLSDFFRPITRRGIIRFTDVALGLSLFVPKIDLILSSHFTRAVQTAEILHAQFSEAHLEYSKLLNPETPINQFLKFIKSEIQNPRSQEPDFTIAIVGHQPELTQFISMLLINKKDINLRLKKGGAALVSITQADVRRPELRWLMSGRQLVEFARVYEELRIQKSEAISGP